VRVAQEERRAAEPDEQQARPQLDGVNAVDRHAVRSRQGSSNAVAHPNRVERDGNCSPAKVLLVWEDRVRDRCGFVDLVTLKRLRRSLDPMLDKTHALMLRGVAKGIVDGKAPAPALQALIDAGLVEEQSGQRYVVTGQGRRVLALER